MTQSDESQPGAAGGAVLDDDERRELESLRREVATLRAAPAAPTPAPAPQRRRIRWASLAAAVLLVLGCVGVPASVIAVWTHNQVADTDSFVATVSPLIEDPAVQAALANRVTTEVVALVDVQKLATEAIDALAATGLRPQLIDRLRGLTGPLADGVTNLVREKVEQLVASPQFIAAWNRALQIAHEQANQVLSGQSAAITIQGDMAVLDLAPFIDAAKQRLVESGFAAAARIPEVHPTIDLFPASILVRAQTAYSLLDAVATWLPWITLLLLAAGVYLAKHHRRAVLAAGLGVVAGMLVLAAALLVARGLIVGAVPEQGAAAAAAGFDILVAFLRAALRTIAVLGLIVALGAYLAGPSTAAVQIRTGLSRGIVALRRGRVAAAIGSGPVGPWVHAHRVLLRVAALGLAVLVFLLIDQPSGVSILLIAIGLVVVLGVIEFLDQVPEEPTAIAPTAGEDPDGVPEPPTTAASTAARIPDQVPEPPTAAASTAAGVPDQVPEPPATTASTAAGKPS